MDCLFCKIGAGEIESSIVYEDNDIKVFKDISPKAPVHLLLIPKLHIQSIAHLEDKHIGIITKLIYTAKRIASEHGLTGYQLIFNVGKEGGQVVGHLHLHLLGGWQKEDQKSSEPINET